MFSLSRVAFVGLVICAMSSSVSATRRSSASSVATQLRRLEKKLESLEFQLKAQILEKQVEQLESDVAASTSFSVGAHSQSAEIDSAAELPKELDELRNKKDCAAHTDGHDCYMDPLCEGEGWDENFVCRTATPPEVCSKISLAAGLNQTSTYKPQCDSHPYCWSEVEDYYGWELFRCNFRNVDFQTTYSNYALSSTALPPLTTSVDLSFVAHFNHDYRDYSNLNVRWHSMKDSTPPTEGSGADEFHGEGKYITVDKDDISSNDTPVTFEIELFPTTYQKWETNDFGIIHQHEGWVEDRTLSLPSGAYEIEVFTGSYFQNGSWAGEQVLTTVPFTML